MTFRRRLFIATVTLGGGICCFQPIMRARIESRLSEIMRAKVEIGSSKISLVDGTIALRNVVVHSSQDESGTGSQANLNRIPQVVLKFDWNSLLYRNLKVNSVVATDVHWFVSEPTSEFIPFAVETQSQISLTATSDDSISLGPVIESILQPFKIKMIDESAKQSRTQLSVSTQLSDILRRISEATPSEGALNVLRQTSVVDEAKKQVAPIVQAMAEDRVARKESEKLMTSMRQTAPKKLMHDLGNLKSLPPPKATEDASKLAKSAVAKEWNRNRSMLQLALQSITALRETPANALQMEGQSEIQSNLLNSQFVSKLPNGFTRFLTGKAKGTMQFTGTLVDSPEATSRFELHFKDLSSRDLAESDKPAVNIRLTRDSQPEGPAWLICNVQEMELVQSNSTQFQVVVQRLLDNRNKCLTTIQHANQGWSATISIPLTTCIDPSKTSLSVGIPRPNNEPEIVGKLIGTTSAMSGDQNEILIEIEPSGIKAIEALLKPSYELEKQKEIAQAERRGTEKLNFELTKIDARWEQLGDEHARAHESWEASLKDLNKQFEKLESAFKRTSRATTGRAQ